METFFHPAAFPGIADRDARGILNHGQFLRAGRRRSSHCYLPIDLFFCAGERLPMIQSCTYEFLIDMPAVLADKCFLVTRPIPRYSLPFRALTW